MQKRKILVSIIKGDRTDTEKCHGSVKAKKK